MDLPLDPTKHGKTFPCIMNLVPWKSNNNLIFGEHFTLMMNLSSSASLHKFFWMTNISSSACQSVQLFLKWQRVIAVTAMQQPYAISKIVTDFTFLKRTIKTRPFPTSGEVLKKSLKNHHERVNWRCLVTTHRSETRMLSPINVEDRNMGNDTTPAAVEVIKSHNIRSSMHDTEWSWES